MPPEAELPDDISRLSRLNALKLSDSTFDSQAKHIIDAVSQKLGLPTEPVTTTDLDHQLLKAAREGNATRLERLLERGANVDTRDQDGGTPLMSAAGGSHWHSVRTLLERGANVDAVTEVGVNALIYAAHEHASTMVIKALVDAGANVNARTASGATALLIAVDDDRKADPNVVTLLLDGGADPAAANDAGAAPLIAALAIKDKENRERIVELMMDVMRRSGRG